MPKETEIHSGVLRQGRSKLAEKLSSALANTYLTQLKTQNFHWNAVGPLFYSLHKLTEAQYKDMAIAVDAIAERIRAIGFLAPGSFRKFDDRASIQEETGAPTAEKMIEQLVEDNEICSRTLHQTVKEAEAVDDVKTADLLTERTGQHEENTWMLRTILS